MEDGSIARQALNAHACSHHSAPPSLSSFSRIPALTLALKRNSSAPVPQPEPRRSISACPAALHLSNRSAGVSERRGVSNPNLGLQEAEAVARTVGREVLG
jgi:hypothetical protein